MADPSPSNQSLTDTNDFHEWLSATLDGFPAPGPTVAKRLIDVLDPQDLAREARQSDAA